MLKSLPSERQPEGETEAPPGLSGVVRPVSSLNPAEREAMYGLLASYFSDTSPAIFARDLAEKESVILLHDAAGHMRGFSTFMRLQALVEGRTVQAFFSGDTIVHHDYRAETALPRLWAQHVFRLAAEPGQGEVYWFLICSGYKTYRFLPLFFREFYPTCTSPTPPEMQQVLDALARCKFPTEYDQSRGVVRLHGATPLRPAVADVTEARLRDPHVAFFAAANPGHAQGDELACIAPLRVENLTPAGRRMLR
ncbi:MAG: hypothetical protein MUD01_21950 [Chloroflexaceae bacterium]|jgi:hypothetical protein|nr:hypothetical protein [Chloroflexaceae bacterium]